MCHASMFGKCSLLCRRTSDCNKRIGLCASPRARDPSDAGREPGATRRGCAQGAAGTDAPRLQARQPRAGPRRVGRGVRLCERGRRGRRGGDDGLDPRVDPTAGCHAPEKRRSCSERARSRLCGDPWRRPPQERSQSSSDADAGRAGAPRARAFSACSPVTLPRCRDAGVARCRVKAEEQTEEQARRRGGPAARRSGSGPGRPRPARQPACKHGPPRATRA